ncbi:hypothetical protein Q0Z83_110600 [Actinoplanes sichuanensis]|nr:hypothetical protein Q0Z83_110600 [Actinoplanes sichuanensis]
MRSTGVGNVREGVHGIPAVRPGPAGFPVHADDHGRGLARRDWPRQVAPPVTWPEDCLALPRSGGGRVLASDPNVALAGSTAPLFAPLGRRPGCGRGYGLSEETLC